MMQRPTYAVDSIDRTLAALELLTQREAMRLSDLADEPRDIVLLATLLGLPQSDLDAAQSAAVAARVAARPRPVAETELARMAVLANRWTSPL